MSTRFNRYTLIAFVIFSAGCANITTPTGGRRDTIPPKLVEISPADSLRNTRVKRIEMYFDEYITVSDATKEVQLSPILSIAPSVTGLNKHVVVKIVDSLLEDSTTYRLSFGNAIKDVHEGNPFAKYTYTFSTGPYFDSLMLTGSVINAATGLADSGGTDILLYSAAEKDSAVVKHKPKYVTKTDNRGKFVFKGLPERRFKMYALRDANTNLIYDGPPDMIAFTASTVLPGDSAVTPVLLKLFTEIADTAKKTTDTVVKDNFYKNKLRQNNTESRPYVVNVDTTDASKRTFDINGSIKITFNQVPQLNEDKISLSYDKNGVSVPALILLTQQNLKSYILLQAGSKMQLIPCGWQKDLPGIPQALT